MKQRVSLQARCNGESPVLGSFVKDITVDQLKFPEWQRPYQDALSELDPAKLTAKIAAAEAAIAVRLASIPEGPESREERQAINDALSALRVLKRENQRPHR